MPTYVITGVSRGLGLEFLRSLSSKAENTVIGLVRNKEATEKKVAEELKDAPGKIHIISVDLESHESIKAAADETASLTGGAIDYLVANAAIMTESPEFFHPIGDTAADPVKLENDLNKLIKTNVTGNIHLYNSFVPLILKGDAKKVIFISSGISDFELLTSTEVEVSPLYTISKAAFNTAVAKYSAQYKKDGVLFLSICPGVVDNGGPGVDFTKLNEAEQQAAVTLFGKFSQLNAEFKGPMSAAESVKKVISVWENATLEDGGKFLPSTGIPGKWI